MAEPRGAKVATRRESHAWIFAFSWKSGPRQGGPKICTSWFDLAQNSVFVLIMSARESFEECCVGDYVLVPPGTAKTSPPPPGDFELIKVPIEDGEGDAWVRRS